MAVDETSKSRRMPGVEGIWAFIGFDSAFFALLFFMFMKARHTNPTVFDSSREALNFTLGGLDTLILLTSSWLVAFAVQALKRGQLYRVPRFLLGGALTGLMFVVSKSVEYTEKFVAGTSPATNDFYMWYFVLTGLHLLHVLAGISLLAYVWTRSRHRTYNSVNRAVLECVASFWHLVDLLWIILFPLLYLQR